MKIPLQLSNITPRYLMDTRRYLSLAILFGFVSLLVLGVGVIPQIQAALQIQQETNVENKKLTALEQKVRQLENVLTPEILAQIDTVNLLLPSRKPLLDLLSSLNVVAGQAQVSFTGIELSPGSIATDSASLADQGTKRKGKGSSASDSLDVKLKVQGSLAQLNQFFELVERTTPLTTITSLSLSPKNKAVGLTSEGLLQTNEEDPTLAQQYEAELDVSAAYFTQSVSAAVDAALPTLNRSQQEIVDELATFSVQQVNQQPSIQGGGLEDLFGVTQPPVEVTN